MLRDEGELPVAALAKNAAARREACRAPPRAERPPSQRRNLRLLRPQLALARIRAGRRFGQLPHPAPRGTLSAMFRSRQARATETPPSLTGRTAASLNSQPNVRHLGTLQVQGLTPSPCPRIRS